MSETAQGRLLELLVAAADDIPDLPEELLRHDKRPNLLVEFPGEDAYDGHDTRLLDSPRDLSGILTVANIFATPFNGGIVCTRNWQQVPCSPEGLTYDIDLPPWSLVQHPVALPSSTSEDVVYLHLLLESDWRAVFSTSRSRAILLPVEFDETVNLLPLGQWEIDSPIPGCDVVTLWDNNTEDRPWFVMAVDRDEADVSVLVDHCDDDPSVWTLLMLFRNRTELLDVEWSSVPFWWDRTVMFPIPDEILEDPETTSLQIFHVLREEGKFLWRHVRELLIE